MFNLVEKRRWYFLLSALVIIPGIAIMIYSTVVTGAPFRLSIDFAGGVIYDVSFQGEAVTEVQIREVFSELGDDNVIIQQLGQAQEQWLLRDIQVALADNLDAVTATIDALDTTQIGGDITVQLGDEAEIFNVIVNNSEITENDIRSTLSEIIDEDTEISKITATRWSIRASAPSDDTGTVGVGDEALSLDEQVDVVIDGLENLAPIDNDSLRIEAVSPTIGREVTRAALLAVGTAVFVITSFIVIAFRQVPKALRYGVCAIAAMVHDVLLVMGIMSLLGLLLGWEVDALFLTAVLTVVGFSVQDSIVVFDRIRENIPLRLGEPYETIVNRSLWETIHRSLATQLNAFFIMIAILLFGGDTVRQFIFILFIGLVSGSYSSLFTAVPLLVSWEKGEIPFLNQDEVLYEAEA